MKTSAKENDGACIAKQATLYVRGAWYTSQTTDLPYYDTRFYPIGRDACDSITTVVAMIRTFESSDTACATG